MTLSSKSLTMFARIASEGSSRSKTPISSSRLGKAFKEVQKALSTDALRRIAENVDAIRGMRLVWSCTEIATKSISTRRSAGAMAEKPGRMSIPSRPGSMTVSEFS
ncbi:hypothetical protein CH063_06680 [Colletotrichum higginsianum]|uniref:Uncharacterized protein n=1 Tax=Colletotrichum higginsianum (strain IMI 349063) TaxID=759273 RepID=H1V3F2_COLHI|nr:hypothetical protein CH063_06680 [Colletotrichum higginsianum]